ncbi:MAG: recombinase family protein [Erysipelotrichales bacterium]|nr:recombinase family protein [Erysipelotrichales bacterium]
MKHPYNTSYVVAAYERLSKEDERQESSSSIESQKMIIESFARFNGLNIYKHYIDDGFTGSNFNRPAFDTLKRDIEKGIINCVIVKDLSRLGRELYETGTYIEEYFLNKNIRFIAINDGYDSQIGDSMLGIRLSVNDMYLRDTSKKIRSSLDAKRKNGDYIATYPKYGYKKDPSDNHHLIIDPITAPIVKQIYELLATGIGTTMVASKLTSQGIPIPSIYKNENRVYSDTTLSHGNGIWRPQTVKNIATDMMYLGHMVQGRWKKMSYNSSRLVETPKAEWIIVENTHDPIISKDLFDEVQKELSKKKRYTNKRQNNHLLQGLLICKECGHNMSIITRKNKKGTSYFCECNYYAKYSKYGCCSSHFTNYTIIENHVIDLLKKAALKLTKNYDNSLLLKKYTNHIKSNDTTLTKQLNNEISKYQKILNQIYDDKLNGIINENQYKTMSNKYNSLLNDLIYKEKKLHNKANTTYDYKDLINDFMLFNNPTYELMHELIDHIEISKDKEIEIFFKVDIEDLIK